MTLTIPTWAIVLAAIVAPFCAAWIAAKLEGANELVGWHAPSVFGPIAFLVVAAGCWTGLLVWLVMR